MTNLRSRLLRAKIHVQNGFKDRPLIFITTLLAGLICAGATAALLLFHRGSIPPRVKVVAPPQRVVVVTPAPIPPQTINLMIPSSGKTMVYTYRVVQQPLTPASPSPHATAHPRATPTPPPSRPSPTPGETCVLLVCVKNIGSVV